MTGSKTRVHVIGGADVAAELDAKRSIKQGVEVAAALWIHTHFASGATGSVVRRAPLSSPVT